MVNDNDADIEENFTCTRCKRRMYMDEEAIRWGVEICSDCARILEYQRKGILSLLLNPSEVKHSNYFSLDIT